MSNSPFSGEAVRRIDPVDVDRYYRQGFWRDRTMLDDFLEQAERHPDKAAIVTYSPDHPVPRTVTYGQLAAWVDRIAAKLLELGIERDDVVSVQLPNGWEFAAVTLAAMRVGAVVNPLVSIFRHHELSFMLSKAESKLLFVPSAFRGFDHAALAEQLVEELPSLRQAIVAGDAVPEGMLSFERDVLGTPARSSPTPEVLGSLGRRPDEVISVMYTSGTTGEPKGTLHTCNTMWSNGRPLFRELHIGGDDVCFMASTMGHLTGFLWGMLYPLSLGSKVVLQEVWDADGFIELFDTEGVTWTLSATPFVLDSAAAVQRNPKPLATFRYFVCGGAPIPPHAAVAADEVLGTALVPLWGCSESGIITIGRPDDPLEVVTTGDGRPTDIMELRVVDDALDPVGVGQEGRLQVRGPSLFIGYLHRLDLYRENETPDGWFDTGDLGRLRPDGGVRITGRSKDIIIRGGENIPVVEVENALLEHPAVAEVAVVGYADERLGEKGCAVVVPTGEPPTLEELTAHLSRKGMAIQYWPERIKVLDAMPRTPAGKIQKFVLRSLLAEEVGATVFPTIPKA